MMRQWRAGANHWVLALASVREPGLLHRQGIAVHIDESRREDARRFLGEAPARAPVEAVSYLLEHPLQAQSHHLNQLAADAVHGALPSIETAFGRPPEAAIRQRDELKSCVRHAATIHMAEKFAFYLLMAEDSGDFDSAGLAESAEALRGVL